MNAEDNPWAKWERTRSQGRGLFVLRYGVCVFGLGTGCFLAALCYLNQASRHDPDAWMSAIVPLILSPIGGYVWGRLMWDSSESKYLAAKAADRVEQEHKAVLAALTQEVRELREAQERNNGEANRS